MHTQITELLIESGYHPEKLPALGRTEYMEGTVAQLDRASIQALTLGNTWDRRVAQGSVVMPPEPEPEPGDDDGDDDDKERRV